MTAKNLRKLLYGTAAVWLLVAATGCSEGLERLNQVKEQVSTAVVELKEAAGKSVSSIEQVNEVLVKGGAGVIGLLKELNLEIGYQENGVSFKNDGGLSGLLAVEGNRLVLNIASQSNDADTVKTMLRLANAFSPENLLEQRLEAFVGKDQAQEVQLQNGFIRSDGKLLELHLETPII
ncbi:hypothetical protein RAC89_19020 [Paenibacillus sp. GD4]|uniref:hypothetical protein n=1 Tax=Paenibacillus sp. GD4 TaxID=3068890 RepID=UPI002796625F|nr:hypothetical protein [Paenibacillus sp. GD4]MDQ1912488.1 hypothetical protein [Paenibacillus sp. GD4]